MLIHLSRQKHPYHFQKRKEGTFQLLTGDLEIVKEGNRYAFQLGDTLLVKAGEWHKVYTREGCVFEEISSIGYPYDSFYEDPLIGDQPCEYRKTKVDHWMQYFRDQHAI